MSHSLLFLSCNSLVVMFPHVCGSVSYFGTSAVDDLEESLYAFLQVMSLHLTSDFFSIEKHIHQHLLEDTKEEDFHVCLSCLWLSLGGRIPAVSSDYKVSQGKSVRHYVCFLSCDGWILLFFISPLVCPSHRLLCFVIRWWREEGKGA